MLSFCDHLLSLVCHHVSNSPPYLLFFHFYQTWQECSVINGSSCISRSLKTIKNVICKITITRSLKWCATLAGFFTYTKISKIAKINVALYEFWKCNCKYLYRLNYVYITMLHSKLLWFKNAPSNSWSLWYLFELVTSLVWLR